MIVAGFSMRKGTVPDTPVRLAAGILVHFLAASFMSFLIIMVFCCTRFYMVD